MNHLHWMKLYIGDELSNTSHMTPAEFGSYVYLKMHYWRFGCLPTDDERLARIAKVSPEQWRDIRPSIGPLFEENWRCSKLEAQRAEAEDRHRKLSEAGKKGGRPKKEEKPGYKPGFSGEKAWPKQPEPEPEPYSGSNSESGSDPEDSALDRKEGTNTRASRYFPIPASPSDGRTFLLSRNVPQIEIDRCLRMLMAGHLTPYDIEQWEIAA